MYDVFISHANSDKEEYVNDLKSSIDQLGINVFYDKDTLQWGDNWKQKLLEGIKNAEFAIIVISKSFFGREWTEKELHDFLERQNSNGQKIILPILHNISFDELKEHYPSIADIQAIESNKYSCDQIALLFANQLIKRIKTNNSDDGKRMESPDQAYISRLKQAYDANVKRILEQKISQKEPQSASLPMSVVDLDYEDGVALLEANQDKDAFLAFFRSAENGNKASTYKLIEIMQKNQRVVFLDDITWGQIKEIADKGEGYANLLMHFKYYAMGEHNDMAIKYLMRAVKKYETPIAFLQLGISYGWGLGLPQNDVLAKKYYEIALEKGCSLACRYLGQMYLYGGNHVEKNLIKAEEYLRRGVEEGEESCFNYLFHLYATMGTYEKAREIAQRMIDHNIKGGYTIMGNYYVYCVPDQKKAEEWYIEAGKHEENRVWGKLAEICWHNKKEAEAFRYAQKGYSVNDSFSYKMLGYICTENGDYEDAWNYYNQAVHKFGTGYDGLAKLYLDKNYHPDNYSLSDLKHDLELSVKLQNVESVSYLLKVMLMEKGKDCTAVNYENLKDWPDTYEILRMGANGGDKECLYIYGRLLLESDGDIYNPFRGIDFVESAAEQGNGEAMKYAFDYYSKEDPQKLQELSAKIVHGKSYAGQNTQRVVECFLGRGRNKPTMAFVDWLYRSLRILAWEYTDVFYDSFEVFCRSLQSIDEEAKTWLDEEEKTLIDDHDSYRLFVPFYAYLLSQKLSFDYQKNDTSILSFIREEIDIANDVLYVTKMHYFRDLVQIIWPDYTSDEVLKGDFSNERDLRIFYGINDISIPDILEISDESSAYAISNYLFDVSYPEGFNATKTKRFFAAYSELVDSYLNLVEKALAQDLRESFATHPPFVSCSIKDALEYSLQAFKMLIVSQKAFGNRWQEVLVNLTNVNCFPKLADTFDKEDLQNMLNKYYNFIVARNELILFDVHLEHASLKDLADTINAVITEMDENNIPHDFKQVTEDSLPDDEKEWRTAMYEYVATIKNYIINYLD